MNNLNNGSVKGIYRSNNKKGSRLIMISKAGMKNNIRIKTFVSLLAGSLSLSPNHRNYVRLAI